MKIRVLVEVTDEDRRTIATRLGIPGMASRDQIEAYIRRIVATELRLDKEDSCNV